LIVQQLSPDGKQFTPGSVLRTTAEFDSDKRARGVANDSHDIKSESQPVADTSANEQTDNRFEDVESFISSIWEHAKNAAQKIGLNPAVMVAQAALETGWGKHIISKADGTSSNNLFNIKSDRSWQGDKASKVTLEFEQGVPVKKQASFRSYQSIKDSVNDFVDFLNENPRYQEALNNTAEPAAFLDSLQKAGYATDPNYADKIKQVLKRVELQSVAASLVR
ncbi:MAG: flagellar assembly peptidoglycan hydrolase FlgJ, partial [Pseudomonadota bacterium]